MAMTNCGYHSTVDCTSERKLASYLGRKKLGLVLTVCACTIFFVTFSIK